MEKGGQNFKRQEPVGQINYMICMWGMLNLPAKFHRKKMNKQNFYQHSAGQEKHDHPAKRKPYLIVGLGNLSKLSTDELNDLEKFGLPQACTILPVVKGQIPCPGVQLPQTPIDTRLTHRHVRPQ